MKWITSTELTARRMQNNPQPKPARTCKVCGKGKPEVKFRSDMSRKCDGCLTESIMARRKRYTDKRQVRRNERRAKGLKREY